MTITPAHVDQLLEHLTERDADAALALVMGLADDGVPTIDLFTSLVAPAQVEVGNRWHRATYSVADEHAATAMVDSIVSVLGAHTPALDPDGPSVVVVCAEGEWHLLAARLIAEVLKSEGFAVTFLGASMPASHLARFLRGSRPDAVAISCTTAMALHGVLLCTQVSHHAGVPVMVGGRAMGPDDHRATVLGADLWAPDARAAVDLLRAPLPTTLARTTADVRGATELARRADEIVARAVGLMQQHLTDVAAYDDVQRKHTREDLHYLLDFARAAVLARDPRLFLEVLPWLEVLLAARSVPPATLHASLQHLAAASDHPGLDALLAQATDRA